MTDLAATVSPAGESSGNVDCSRFHQLPFELRDMIYAYASLTADTWIDVDEASAFDKNHIKGHKRQPACYIKSKHSFVLVSRETRNEYRSAVWHLYMSTATPIAFRRIWCFEQGPLLALLDLCSSKELQALQRQDKCIMHLDLTGIIDTSGLDPYDEYEEDEDAALDILAAFESWEYTMEERSLQPQYVIASIEDAEEDHMAMVMEDVLAERPESVSSNAFWTGLRLALIGHLITKWSDVDPAELLSAVL